MKNTAQIVVGSILLMLTWPLFGINLPTIRPTRATLMESGSRGIVQVNQGVVLSVPHYDSRLPNQVGTLRGHTYSIPTVDLEPGPTSPPEILSEPNDERETVCTDMGALQGFFNQTKSDQVGVVYCANAFSLNAAAGRFDILDAIASSRHVVRTKVVVVLAIEKMGPLNSEPPGFIFNGKLFGSEMRDKSSLIESMPRNTKIALFRRNPTNALSYLIGSGVKHILLISSFADPLDPSVLEGISAQLAEKKIALSVFSTPTARISKLLGHEITPVMLVSFKPADEIYRLVKDTGGIVYLDRSATEKQPRKITEIALPSVR